MAARLSQIHRWSRVSLGWPNSENLQIGSSDRDHQCRYENTGEFADVLSVPAAPVHPRPIT